MSIMRMKWLLQSVLIRSRDERFTFTFRSCSIGFPCSFKNLQTRQNCRSVTCSIKMILFRDLDKYIRCDPSEFRMMQTAQGFQCDKAFFLCGIYRLVVKVQTNLLRSLYADTVPPVYYRKPFMVWWSSCITSVSPCFAVIRIPDTRHIQDAAAVSQFFCMEDTAYDRRDRDTFIFYIQLYVHKRSFSVRQDNIHIPSGKRSGSKNVFP